MSLRMDFFKKFFKETDWKKVIRSKKVWLAGFAMVIAILEAAGVPVGEGMKEGFDKIVQILTMIGFFG